MSISYQLAPMEGITNRIYRNALHDFFGTGIDRYYTPFLVVHEKRAMSSKDLREILPENNRDICLVPQILADDAEGFLRIESALHGYGYGEVNLNLGCPSKTVASKGRGSGFLGRLRELDDFLYTVYEKSECDVSIKTRIGEKSPDEFEELLVIFNKYPVKELIIHPRIRYEYYKGKPHRDVFFAAVKESDNPVCYNGDIMGKPDVDEVIQGSGSRLDGIMAGRGVLKDPSLIRTLTGGRPYTKDELREFLKRLRIDYSAEFSGETPVLKKLKELWTYMAGDFPQSGNDIKELFKCKSLAGYGIIEMKILDTLDMR